MKKWIIVLFVGSFLFAHGQDKNSIEIGASFFGMRQFKELPSDDFKHKSFTFFPKGIVINSVGTNLRTALEFSFYNQKSELNGTNCYDCIGGTGELRGIETKMGIFKDYNFGPFSFSTGLSAYFIRTKVKGTYYGGIAWSEWEVNSRTNYIGINPTISFGFEGFKPFLVSFETGGFLGRLYGANIDKRFANERFLSPIQSISIRYKMK
jgi:hypothetical protein